MVDGEVLLSMTANDFRLVGLTAEEVGALQPLLPLLQPTLTLQ
jgi:hypothetical protein